MVRPGRSPDPAPEPDPRETDPETPPTRGEAFRRALDGLPARDAAPATPAPQRDPQPTGTSANGGDVGASGTGPVVPGGAPAKVIHPDEIAAPRLEASLAKLFGNGEDAKPVRAEAGKRSRTLPPPPKAASSRTAAAPTTGRTPPKVTRIVVPRPPVETRNATKLPPLKPTRLIKAPPPTTPSAAPVKAAPATKAKTTDVPLSRMQQAAAALDAKTAAPTAPARTPPAGPPPGTGEITNEFESLLEGLLESRDGLSAATAEHLPSEPTPRLAPSSGAPGLGDFSVDTQIFPAQGGTSANLSDFVSKILDELDSIVDTPAGPAGAEEPSRAVRETEAFEARAELPKRGAGAPGVDKRSSKETGEFEEGQDPDAPRITTDDLSALSDLFSDD